MIHLYPSEPFQDPTVTGHRSVPPELRLIILGHIPDFKSHLRLSHSCRGARNDFFRHMKAQPRLLTSYIAIFKKQTAPPHATLSNGAITLRFANASFSHEELNGLFRAGQHISGIDLWNVKAVEKRSIEDLFSKLELKEYHAPKSTENYEGIQFPVSLRLLDMRFSKVTGPTLQGILTRCTQLEELDVRSCGQIAPEAFVDASYPKSLKRLIVKDTKITPSEIERVKRSCPWIDIVNE